MIKTTTLQIKQARPNDKEVEAFWKLYRAAQRVENRWCQTKLNAAAAARLWINSSWLRNGTSETSGQTSAVRIVDVKPLLPLRVNSLFYRLK